MTKKKTYTHFRALFVAVMIGMLAFSSSQAQISDVSKTQNKPLRIGILACRSLSATRAAYQPLAEYLSSKLDRPVELIVPRSAGKFWKRMAAGEFDLVRANQYHYVRAHKELGYRVIAAQEIAGQTSSQSMLSVRKDSQIGSLDDLRGKSIIFGGGPQSMESYIVPRAMLKNAGLEQNRDYFVMFSRNAGGAVLNTYRHIADAAGHDSSGLEKAAQHYAIKGEDIQVLARSKSFQSMPWVARKDMNLMQRKRIQSALVGMKNSPEGRKILANVGISGYQKAVDQDYNGVRELIAYATGQQF
ncbi:MAG: phosphate/phosphite/phosphonate ABC transporter substrate-binding protein [gamma proteobacterium symbiont of Bathyaustriella thionipta]|nr:phosphate/phosphite/phosphonate ABC transporter substrate-binding protein [gamma proteobacterium symbiont of Bathyaustriella thionipta]